MVKYNIIITAQAKKSLQQIYDYVKEERSAFRMEEDNLEVIVIEILNMKMSTSRIRKRLGLE